MTPPEPTGPMTAAGGSWGTVIVTGGSSGLGAAVVDLVRSRGGRPVVLDRQSPAETTGLEWVKVDLADAHAAHEAAREAAEAADHLTGVVTAAGTDACGRLVDTPLDDWVRVIAVNLVGTAAVARATAPALERSGGRLVTIASTLGLKAVSDAQDAVSKGYRIKPGDRVDVQYYDDKPNEKNPRLNAQKLYRAKVTVGVEPAPVSDDPWASTSSSSPAATSSGFGDEPPF